jgi:hypothetical protein
MVRGATVPSESTATEETRMRSLFGSSAVKAAGEPARQAELERRRSASSGSGIADELNPVLRLVSKRLDYRLEFALGSSARHGPDDRRFDPAAANGAASAREVAESARTMRRVLMLVLPVVLAFLAVPAAAAAATQTASSGAVTATLSYTGTPSIITKVLRLSISQSGSVVYDEAITSTLCGTICSPAIKDAVHVVDLAGDGTLEVVLDLWSGGANCCAIEQVYTLSSALSSYVLTERNFGNYGAVLRRLGRGTGYEFVSGDTAFYCDFTACAASGLPIQILSFSGLAFHNVTRSYPALIRKDAAVWWKAYQQHSAFGEGVIAAWAADQDMLDRRSTVSKRLAQLVSAHGLTASFVAGLQRFLKRLGYVR